MFKISRSWSIPVTIVFLIIIWLGVFSTHETDQKSYIVVAVYFTYMIICIFLRGKFVILKYPLIISGTMFFVWIYGLVLGVLNGNDTANIIRNFAGLAVYLLVIPLMNSNVKNEQYIKVIKKLSVYALLITIFTYVMLTFFHFDILYNIPVINAFVGGGGIGGFVQYFCRELIHVTFAYNFFILLDNKRSLLSFIIVALCALEAVFINDSGGDALAMGVLVIVIVLIQIQKMKPKAVIMALAGIVFLGALYIYRGEGLLNTLFSSDDGGNIRRWVEINYFMSHMSILGYGLGAPLGYAGAGGLYSYGTEMIYLNIFHKFGIFAMLIILCYVDTCIKSIQYLRKNYKPESVIPISLMAYLIPSLANPMLFSTSTVLSHIIAMILVTSNENRTNNFK